MRGTVQTRRGFEVFGFGILVPAFAMDLADEITEPLLRLYASRMGAICCASTGGSRSLATGENHNRSAARRGALTPTNRVDRRPIRAPRMPPASAPSRFAPNPVNSTIEFTRPCMGRGVTAWRRLTALISYTVAAGSQTT